MSNRKAKTYLMQLVERDHANIPIQDLMIEAYHSHGTERAAAHALGITQQSFNAWKFRLGIEDQLTPEAIRNRVLAVENGTGQSNGEEIE